MKQKDKNTGRKPAFAADPVSMASAAFAGFRSMNRIGSTMFTGWTDFGAEFMTFLANRIQEDVKTQQRMLQCKDMQELAKIQSEFVQRALDQYAAETGRMIDLGQNMTIRAFQNDDDDEAEK